MLKKNIVRQKDFGKDFGLIHEVMVTGRKVGMTEKLWAQLAHDQKLFRRVISYLRLSKPTTEFEIAKKILRENFLGPEEVTKYFHIRFSQEEEQKIEKVPFSKETLFQCAHSHLLVLGVPHNPEGKPLTIYTLARMFHDEPEPDYLWEELRNEKFFAGETLQFQWYLVNKCAHQSLWSLTHKLGPEQMWYNDWVKFFKGKGQEFGYIERAVIYYYTMVLWQQSRNDRLYRDTFQIWTSSQFEKELPKRYQSDCRQVVIKPEYILENPFHPDSWIESFVNEPEVIPVRKTD